MLNYLIKIKRKLDHILKIINDYGLEPISTNIIEDDVNLPSKKILEFLYVLKTQEKVINISDKLMEQY